MNRAEQSRRARTFRALHDGPKPLVLPNIWDPLGARLLESMGYPAVATASAAVAFSLGYDDGEQIRFDVMLDVVRRIADAVDVPVTADIESGYAASPDALAANIRDVLRAGAVGINLEDSIPREGRLRSLDEQCERLRAARAAADAEGVPLVINARTDTFLLGIGDSPAARLRETIARGRAYAKAGADVFYPIVVGDLDSLRSIRAEVELPINVYLGGDTAPLRDLEALGIHRVSVGPGMLRAGVTAMKRVAEELRDYGSYERFTEQALSSDEIRALVSSRPMPPDG